MSTGLTPQELVDDFKSQFHKRRFSAGLLIAMVDLLSEIDTPDLGASSFEDVLTHHPRRERTAQGNKANTLILEAEDGTLSLRPFYNRAEKNFFDNYRYDYPSCAPHATQAWGQYPHWLDSLSTFSQDQLDFVRKAVIDHVLAELPSHELDPDSIEATPPAFRNLLKHFSFESRQGEPTGAAYQGAVFGFLRADNPHLQVEVDNVRTGSRRRNRFGDIDAWDGDRLAISAEVKFLRPDYSQVMKLKPFADEVRKRAAMGLFVCLEIEQSLRDSVKALQLIPLDLENLIDLVRLWDPIKQRVAISSMTYYIVHVERNMRLRTRLQQFLESPHAKNE